MKIIRIDNYIYLERVNVVLHLVKIIQSNFMIKLIANLDRLPNFKEMLISKSFYPN